MRIKALKPSRKLISLTISSRKTINALSGYEKHLA